MSAPTELKVAKHGGNLFLRAVGWLSSLCGIIAAFLIVCAIGLTCQMLYVRFWLGESTIWQTETVTFMMVAATLIGLPYVQRLRGHVNVDLIPLMLPLGARKMLAIIVMLASLIVIGMMAWYGYEMFHVAYKRGWTTDSVWGPKLWPIYLTVPVGLALLMLQLAADLFATIKGVEEPFSIEPETERGQA
jgi:TRAP-type C4-dicarboxylate transport system permease small subunit